MVNQFPAIFLQAHHLFVDYKVECDAAKRDLLADVLGFPAKLIRLIQATFDRSISGVRIADEVFISFVTLNGTKEDDAFQIY